MSRRSSTFLGANSMSIIELKSEAIRICVLGLAYKGYFLDWLMRDELVSNMKKICIHVDKAKYWLDARISPCV